MPLSNNSTPSQSVERVDPEGSCKKDNQKAIISLDEFVSKHLISDNEGNVHVPEFQEDYLRILYGAYCAGFKAALGDSI